jgi:predicted transcriptional regulator
MRTTTIRVRSGSHKALKELAEVTGQSLQDALEQAIEEQRRKLYLEGLNADYAAINQNPAARAALAKEIEAWDVTNEDGLEG